MNTQGFIALASVLMLSAIFLVISIGLASGAIDTLTTATRHLEAQKARYAAEACVEHVLLELQRTLQYEEGEVILMHDASCEVLAIEGEGMAQRTIRVEGRAGSHVYGLEMVLGRISPDVLIISSERMHF